MNGGVSPLRASSKNGQCRSGDNPHKHRLVTAVTGCHRFLGEKARRQRVSWLTAPRERHASGSFSLPELTAIGEPAPQAERNANRRCQSRSQNVVWYPHLRLRTPAVGPVVQGCRFGAL